MESLATLALPPGCGFLTGWQRETATLKSFGNKSIGLPAARMLLHRLLDKNLLCRLRLCVDVDNVWQPPSELHTEVGQPKPTHPPKQGHSSLKQDIENAHQPPTKGGRKNQHPQKRPLTTRLERPVAACSQAAKRKRRSRRRTHGEGL